MATDGPKHFAGWFLRILKDHIPHGPLVLVSASKHQIFTLFPRYNLDTLRPFTVCPSNCCHTHRFITLMEGLKGHATFSADLESSLLCPSFPLLLLSLSFSSLPYRSQLLSCSRRVLFLLHSSFGSCWQSCPTGALLYPSRFLQANKHNALSKNISGKFNFLHLLT